MSSQHLLILELSFIDWKFIPLNFTATQRVALVLQRLNRQVTQAKPKVYNARNATEP